MAQPELSQTARGATNLRFAAAALATGAALFWSTGLRPHWWLTWLAPLPVLLISSRLPRRRAFGVATAAWFLGSLNMWPYLLSVVSIPAPIVLLFSAVPGCVFGLAVLLFRRFILRGEVWRAAVSFPALWVTFEYLSNTASPHGTFPNLGYSQMDFVPIIQVTSVVGIWGITFCLLLLPAAIAAVLSRPGNTSRKQALAFAAGLFLALVIGWGFWRVLSAPLPGHSVRVGLIASGVDSSFPHDDAAALSLLEEYAGKAAALAAEGAQVVLLPEKIARISDQSARHVDVLYAATSARARAMIVLGVDRGAPARRFNEARLYSSEGTLSAVYRKQHLVPGLEGAVQPGATIAALKQPSGMWGVQICKDMDFPTLSRRYGAEGVGLLLVPAWDFTLDGWLHSRMAVLRGVESGFSVVRAARQGMLTVSDSRGRVLAQRDATALGFAYLSASVPVRHERTLYVRWGDWFAWLNAAGLIGLLGWYSDKKD